MPILFNEAALNGHPTVVPAMNSVATAFMAHCFSKTTGVQFQQVSVETICPGVSLGRLIHVNQNGDQEIELLMFDRTVLRHGDAGVEVCWVKCSMLQGAITRNGRIFVESAERSDTQTFEGDVLRDVLRDQRSNVSVVSPISGCTGLGIQQFTGKGAVLVNPWDPTYYSPLEFRSVSEFVACYYEILGQEWLKEDMLSKIRIS
jgi:hypothetical protein